MKKPKLVYIENLLMPITATQKRLEDIKIALLTEKSNLDINGYFLMLVSYVESMQKEIIKHYLKYQPEKITDKNIEVDKSILSENDDFTLVEHIISNYIDNIPYWKLSKLFYEVLKIDKPSNQNIIEEIKKRRNELIHNNLKIDFKHKRIHSDYITKQYLIESIKYYEENIQEIKLNIRNRYSYLTRIKLLKELWSYSFSTPLCSNFEEFWYLNYEKDSIEGYKNPKQELSLSQSETFLLQIWRSQVTQYKVDFFNMSSLDKHSQYCLYTFLKISNDIFLYI